MEATIGFDEVPDILRENVIGKGRPTDSLLTH